MRKIMSKAQSIRLVVLVIAVLAIISVFPMRLWHESIITSGKEHPAGAVSVSGDAAALQQFSAEYDHINSIGVYLNEDTSANEFVLRVFDAGFALLRERTYELSDAQVLPGYADVYINLDTEVGATYYYAIECSDGNLGVPFEMTGNSGAANNGYMQYAGENKDAFNLVTRYTYEQPLRKVKSLLCIVIIAAVCAAIWALLYVLEKKITALSTFVTLQWGVKLIGNPLVIIAAVFALVCVGPLHLFSIYICDLIVMSLGVILLAAILLYAINHDASADGFDIYDYVVQNWQNLLQAVCIALALWACVNYMNALYEVFHDIAWRKMAFFLGLGLIVTFSLKELVNWLNLALLAAGAVIARIYYVKNLPAMVDEYHTEAMVWTCRLMPIILILVAYIIKSFIIAVKGKGRLWERISWPYATLCIITAGAMIVQRNTRYWPVMMSVVVAIIALRYLFWDKRAAFVDNICNGILIHFSACLLYCLWHRPYEAFTYVRFPFVFHTVTITAEYLSLVLAAAAVKLFEKYNKTKKIKSCLFEIFMFGAVASYVLFTMSRTGLIAVVAMGLTMWVAYSFGKGKERIKSLASMALMVVVSVFICIPIFFTLQKTIPAVVGEPEIMLVEVYPEELYVSTDWTDYHYITFSRFAKAFANKILGIDEDKIRLDLYTINGRRTDLEKMKYIPETNPEVGYEPSQDSKAEYDDIGVTFTKTEGLMLTAGIDSIGAKVMSADEEQTDFVPPHEYRLDGDPPPEWWDPDYWYYSSEDQEWHFNSFKLDTKDEQVDLSNGRIDIYKAYLEQLTMEGHESMGAILSDGSEAAHAHDIYLQVAFDHGIIVGALFAIWVFATCIQALIVFIKKRKNNVSVGIVLAVAVTYAVAGLTEWISHPCNPVGMVILLVLVPMAIYKDGKDKKTV